MPGCGNSVILNGEKYPGQFLLNFKPPRKQVLFNWTAYYKSNSLPSSTVGSSSASGLIGCRKRRT